MRHLTEVEAYRLRTVLLGKDVVARWSTKGDPDADLDGATPNNAAASIEAYEQQLNLRWILIHLVEAYARHLGHMDLLREAVDGETGY